MSLKKSTLLAGASLVACLLAAPTMAAAAVNPCGETPANDGVIVCPVATYATGIQHTSAGDLSVTVQIGSDFGTGGVVSTSGGAADDLTLRLTGTGSSSFYQLNTAFPALLNAESQTGDVLVEVKVDRTDTNAPTITAENSATTRFVRAFSTAGGDVTVRNLSMGTAGGRRNGVIQANGNASAVAIEARSVGGGDVAVDIGGTAIGRLYGILAQADGDGTISINGTGIASTSTAGSAGLRVIAGTGAVTIIGGVDDQLGRRTPFMGRTGAYIDADGDITFTGSAFGADYGIDILGVASGTTTTLNLTHGGASGGIAAVRAQGAGTLFVNVLGPQSGMNFDFTGMAAPVEVAISGGGAWRLLNSSTVVAAGNFSIDIASDGALIAGTETDSGSDTLEPPTVVTFTNPAMSINNAGFILIGQDDLPTGSVRMRNEAELRLVGLNELRHSGSMLLGVIGYGAQGPGIDAVDTDQTDRWHDDLFVFEDGTWIGEGGKIVFDVDTSLTQTTCVREAVTNDFAAADCVRFVDSTVEGVTYLGIEQTIAGDRGRLTQEMMDDGILLIETPGSTVSAENFALDPGIRNYNPRSGSLDKGLYQYVLLFDEAAEEFKLFPTLSGAAYQLPMAATAAQGLWRLSTGSWFERQADLRGGIESGVGGGVWLRASGEQADREVTNASTLGGLPFSVDNTHQANTYAITGGADLISASGEGMGYVVGLMAGYAHADVEYEVSTNAQAMDAWTGGLYASFISGGLFVDAAVNASNVILDTDAPGFQFHPEGTILSLRLVTAGAQAEAGWRLPLSEGFFAEPLASVSYVRSKLEDLQIRPDDGSRAGLEVSYDDPVSFRAGLGGRVGMDQDFGVVRTQVSVLGRMWNEFDGESTASIHNLAFPTDPNIPVTDDFSGQFNELAVGASVYSAGGAISGFVNLGGKFGDDYEAKTGSMGVRVAW